MDEVIVDSEFSFVRICNEGSLADLNWSRGRA